jgi:hypothetical protein
MPGGPIPALGGKTWADLEVLEHADGQLMFPAQLRRRDTKGAVVETKVRVRSPSAHDKVEARTDAIAWAVKGKIDRKEDKDLFDELEQICLLSKAVRTFEAPHGQFAIPQDLARYDDGCLKDIQEQINAFEVELDPRPSIQSEEDVWRTFIAVAREASLDPLVGTAGRDQASLIVRMALEACRSPTGLRMLQSLGISLPDSSTPASSEQS